MSEGNIPWRCKACNNILGFLDSRAEVLRIKVRDIYIYVAGGAVSITCRGCGLINELQQSDPTILIQQKKKETQDGVQCS